MDDTFYGSEEVHTNPIGFKDSHGQLMNDTLTLRIELWSLIQQCFFFVSKMAPTHMRVEKNRNVKRFTIIAVLPDFIV